jgi:hypothetical protein
MQPNTAECGSLPFLFATQQHASQYKQCPKDALRAPHVPHAAGFPLGYPLAGWKNWFQHKGMAKRIPVRSEATPFCNTAATPQYQHKASAHVVVKHASPGKTKFRPNTTRDAMEPHTQDHASHGGVLSTGNWQGYVLPVAFK